MTDIKRITREKMINDIRYPALTMEGFWKRLDKTVHTRISHITQVNTINKIYGPSTTFWAIAHNIPLLIARTIT